MTVEVPAGLSDLLRQFTIAVLRQQPDDLNDFAYNYFTHLQRKKKGPVPMYVVVDSDDDANEPEPETFLPRTAGKQKTYARRQSVAAERFDPEEECARDDEKVVYPKSDAQRQRLTESVKDILLFRALEPEQMQDVVNAMFERRVTAKEHVIDQGDDGDNFYVIETGTYNVYVTKNGKKTQIHQFSGSGCFGELALMYNMPRTATIVSTHDGTLWAMDRASFRGIILKSAFRKRRMYEKLLGEVPMLNSLDEYERMNLADALTTQTYADGACIIRQGDAAVGMYFIEKGEVRVTLQQGDGGEADVVNDSPTCYFGEMALVENQPRSASVYANGNVKVAFLEREQFERLLGPCIDVMKRKIRTYQQSSGSGGGGGGGGSGGK